MKIKYPNPSVMRLNIDSFDAGINTSKDANLTNLNYAISAENFSFADGALKNGLGFSDISSYLAMGEQCELLKQDLKAIGSIEKIFHFYKYDQETNQRKDKLIFVSSLHQLYYVNLYDENKRLNSIRNITFTTSPVAVRYRLNGEDVIIFSSETDNMVVWDGEKEPYTVLDAPKISSMAIHYERLFATVDGEKNAVWFSDDLDPTNWSLSLEEAGFIELIDERGALLKVVSFLDYVYIFREYGISRLTAYADQTTFAVSNLFVSSGKIYPSSVCVCGDRIIFLAADGLYAFDGVNTTKILKNISNNLISQNNFNATACYYNGCYYLSCKFDYAKHSDNCDTFYNNAILCIDAIDMKLKSITHGINIKYICGLDYLNGVIVLATDDEKNAFYPYLIDKNASFNGKMLKKVWISPTSKFGAGFNKNTLRKVNIETAGDVELTIYSDNKERKIMFSGSILPQSKRLNLPLYNFSFRLESTSQVCNIKNLEFEFCKSKSY